MRTIVANFQQPRLHHHFGMIPLVVTNFCQSFPTLRAVTQTPFLDGIHGKTAFLEVRQTDRFTLFRIKQLIRKKLLCKIHGRLHRFLRTLRFLVYILIFNVGFYQFDVIPLR